MVMAFGQRTSNCGSIWFVRAIRPIRPLRVKDWGQSETLGSERRLTPGVKDWGQSAV